MTNICLDPDTEDSIRDAKGWDEIFMATHKALDSMSGVCLLELASTAKLSLDTIYKVRRGARVRNSTLRALVGAMVPDHPLAATGACAIRRPPPILPEGWKVHPTHPKYAYRGQDVKLISDLVSDNAAA